MKLLVVSASLLLLSLLSLAEARGNRERGNRNRGVRCQYGKGDGFDRGTCDPTTNKRNMTLVGESSNAASCPATKTKVKNCGGARRGNKGSRTCKYGRRGEGFIRGECDPTSNKRQMTLVLKPRSPSTCAPTKTVEKQCKNRGNTGRNTGRCRYRKAAWSECNTVTNTITRTLTLKKGASECEQTKQETKKCKSPCRYRKGTWSECDSTTGMKQRVDQLKPHKSGRGSATQCQPTRTLEKMCKNKEKCRYSFGEWGECVSGQRTRTKTLEAEQPETCEPTKQVSKSCTNKKGRERCFYGDWNTWGTCQNGVQTKTREVIRGGDKCQRKAVKSRPCQS